MVAIPSETPIPAPIAVGRLAECSCWTGAADSAGMWDTRESVDVLSGEDTVVVITSELAPADKVVVTMSREYLVEADGEGVTGGNPKIEAFV